MDPVPKLGAVKIHVLPSGPIQTNGYLLTEAQRGEAILVDAPGDILARIEPLLAATGCRLTELWLTHGHWDHTQDAAAVVTATGARVVGHEADREMFENPGLMSAFVQRRLQLAPVAVDQWVKQGDRLTALGREFEVRHVPGHCPGNVLFYAATAQVALVGDALFAGGIGRIDFPGGSFEMLARSIREQIYTLPDETVVLSGHGPRTTVGAEKSGNPFVSALVP